MQQIQKKAKDILFLWRYCFIMTRVIHTPATNDNDFKNIVTFLNIYGDSRV